MTSIFALIAIMIPAMLLYSPKVEQNRVVTITRPLVITQERKTPAYYLYQQVKAAENVAPIQPQLTTYLSSQNYIPPQAAVAVNEMKVDRREIASAVDAGFNTAAVNAAASETNILHMLPTEPSNPTVEALSQATNVTQQPEPSQLSPMNKWATVRGKFETRGIGVIDQIIELKRVEEGQTREVGRVDLRAGSYSIDISAPQGSLVAEIHDRNGVLIGSDRQKIEKLLSRGSYYEGPFIQVKHQDVMADAPTLPSTPTGPAIASRMAGNLKGQAFNKPVFTTSFFSNQNVLENPTDEYANVARNASTVSYIADQSKTYRPLLTVRQTGDVSETPVFSEKWVQGMMTYISDQQKIEFQSDQISLVIGRVMIDGKPAAGAQVQIENHPGVYPIYLDQFMIPSASQTETSENGYFMFLGLEEGAYTVSAFKQTEIIGHQIFLAEQGSVSYQNILSSQVARSIVVRAFDAFTAEPKDIDLTTPDSEEIIQTTEGSATYRVHSAMGVTQFIARSNEGSYIPIRYFQDARKDYVHIPLIREDWLKQIQAYKRINDSTLTSTFVGFVPDMDYQVYLVYEGYSKDNIVYFDSQGRISPVPVRGGGFILYNVPKDAREVIVQEDGTDRIYSQVISSQPKQVGVAHFVE